MKPRSDCQETTQCSEKRTADKDRLQTQNGSSNSHHQRQRGYGMFPMLYSKLRYQYPMHPINYSVGKTSMLCATAYQKINFIFNGEEMATTDAFVRLEKTPLQLSQHT